MQDSEDNLLHVVECRILIYCGLCASDVSKRCDRNVAFPSTHTIQYRTQAGIVFESVIAIGDVFWPVHPLPEPHNLEPVASLFKASLTEMVLRTTNATLC